MLSISAGKADGRKRSRPVNSPPSQSIPSGLKSCCWRERSVIMRS